MRNNAARPLGELAAHAGKREHPPNLKWAPSGSESSRLEYVRRNAAEALGALAAHAGKENIPQILNMSQAVLCHQDEYVRKRC